MGGIEEGKTRHVVVTNGKNSTFMLDRNASWRYVHVTLRNDLDLLLAGQSLLPTHRWTV